MMKIKTVILITLLVLVVSILPTMAQDEAAQTNKQMIRTALDELAGGDLQSLVDLYAETFLFGVESASADSIELILAAYREGIPDLQIVPNILIAQDDWVAAHVTWTGTFTNTLRFEQNIPPTGETVNWTELLFFRFNDEGEIIEFWTVSDPTIQMIELGVMPSQESEPTGTALEEPAGYQLLSDDELDTTFTSGMEERNTELLQEQLSLGFGTFIQFYADPYIEWNSGVPSSVTATDIQQNAPFFELLSTAIPDQELTADIIVAEGDWVAALGIFRGTFTEDVNFFGTQLAHTDQEITFQVGVVDRYNAEGKIVEEFLESDFSPLLRGLGLIPPTEG